MLSEGGCKWDCERYRSRGRGRRQIRGKVRRSKLKPFCVFFSFFLRKSSIIIIIILSFLLAGKYLSSCIILTFYNFLFGN